jgi:ferrous iron transport protein B
MTDSSLLSGKKRIILLGIPNSGKTTLFNLLTGLNQRTGNYAGVTVDISKGIWKYGRSSSFEIVDLPGLYSLFPSGEDKQDEKAVLHFLKNEYNENEDLLCVITEAARPFKCFFLLTQLLDMGYAPVLILNMKDEYHPNRDAISFLKNFFGIPVLLIQSGGMHPDISEFNGLNSLPAIKNTSAVHFRDITVFPQSSDYKAFIFSSISESTDEMNKKISREKQHRTKVIQYIQEKWKKISPPSPYISKFDALLWKPLAGISGFILSLIIMFSFIFYISEIPMNGIEFFFQWISDVLREKFPHSFLRDLISGGVIPGLSGVLVFVPQIFLLYAVILLLENSGLLTRFSFHLDKPLKKIGLSGQSLMVLLGASACAIPAILSLRALRTIGEKRKLIRLIPLVSCSARIPVYLMFVYILISVYPEWKSLRPLIFLILYLSGPLILILTSYIMTRFFSVTPVTQHFITEVPPMRIPSPKRIFNQSLMKCYEFIREAGTIIFFLSILIWFLSVSGPQKGFMYSFAEKENSIHFSESWLAEIGKKIHPLFRPLGFDEKTSIAILASLSAREVFVGTLSVMYNESDESKLSEKLAKAKDENGMPVFTVPVCLSILVFYIFALQCISTLSITYTETGKKILPVLVQFIIYNSWAYACSYLVYQWAGYFWK